MSGIAEVLINQDYEERTMIPGQSAASLGYREARNFEDWVLTYG